MNDEELQQRLRRIDPAPPVSTHPVTGPRAAALLESIMDTTLTPVHTSESSTPRPQRTRRWAFAAAAATTLVVAGVAAFALRGGDDSTTAATSVEFSLGEAAGPTMGMCLPVTDYVPTPDLVGFKGSVTAVTATSVTVDVSKWFAGGDADVVELNTTDLAIPALDGVEFVVGGEYLVAVLDGQVLRCGLSGPAEPVLEGLYEGWFAG